MRPKHVTFEEVTEKITRHGFDTGGSASADQEEFDLASYLPGSILDGKYAVGNCVGTGSCGWVFQALDRHRRDEQLVCLKVLKLEKYGLDPSLDVEIETAQALRNQHILPIYNLHRAEFNAKGELRRTMYIVSEFCEDGDMGDWAAANRPQVPLVDPGTLGPGRSPEVLDQARDVERQYRVFFQRFAILMRGAAEGLSHMHLRGKIHRDVKPSNLFVKGGRSNEPHALVGDFSISRQAVACKGDVVIGGTKAYLPFEILNGESAAEAADNFAFAATVYEILADRKAFPIISGQDGPLSLMERLLVLPDFGEPLKGAKFFFNDEFFKLLKSGLGQAPEMRPTLGQWEKVFDHYIKYTDKNGTLLHAELDVNGKPRPVTVPVSKNTARNLTDAGQAARDVHGKLVEVRPSPGGAVR